MKQETGTVAIIGRFNFPNGDAASTRVIGIGKILRNIGYDVVFIGKCMQPNNKKCLAGVFQEFKYFNIPNKQSLVSRAKQIIFSGKMTISTIEKEGIKPDIIIYYGNSFTFLQPLLKYTKSKNIKLITDIVEWYDPRQINGGKFNPMWWDVNYTIQKLIPKCDGIIAISSFFQNYYDNKGGETIRIPQLFDTEDSKWEIDKNVLFDEQSLNLVYAGVPGKKDSIDIIIKSIKHLVDKGQAVKLHLFGPSIKQIEDVLADDSHLVNQLQNNIVFHGRIPQNEIPLNLAKADFSVLIRPDLRYAHAGFPTKFVESFAAGVPVIANLTSDIDKYLKDGINGFIVKDNTVENLVEAITKAAKLNKNSKTEMKKNAKLDAINYFYYKNYVESSITFLSKVNSKSNKLVD